jgi:hypothetical protein
MFATKSYKRTKDPTINLVEALLVNHNHWILKMISITQVFSSLTSIWKFSSLPIKVPCSHRRRGTPVLLIGAVTDPEIYKNLDVS